MTSHTATSVAAPGWGALRDGRRTPAERRAREGERAEADLRLRVRGWTGRGVAALAAVLALWAVLWAVFLAAVAEPAASARAALVAREAARTVVASAAGSRP
ncbi:MAG TPA: hypothetical protein VLS93_12560 [Anaeromyxobacteraceae bacterium]|nr:hypothetical protein [Anaeromyxobacteraceae bacterium]